jgi:hypothetical protein
MWYPLLKTEDTTMRNCYKCDELKELSEFHNDRTQAGGKSYECKKCKSENRKKKRQENPEKYREQNRKSKRKNAENIKISQKKHRLANRERILQRRRELREPRKELINLREKERRKSDVNFHLKERIRQKRFRERNKEILKPKNDARKLVMYAVKLGVIKKPNQCEKCNSTGKIEGHHTDYTKPLEVKWLCKLCHKQEHKKYK